MLEATGLMRAEAERQCAIAWTYKNGATLEPRLKSADASRNVAFWVKVNDDKQI